LLAAVSMSVSSGKPLVMIAQCFFMFDWLEARSQSH
jgi:hypothetical protein